MPFPDASCSTNDATDDGAGELMAVADTGFDLGEPAPGLHRAGADAVFARPHRAARTDDPTGHGTPAAGSVLGDGNSVTMGGAIRGTAPGAGLILQGVLDSGSPWKGMPTRRCRCREVRRRR